MAAVGAHTILIRFLSWNNNARWKDLENSSFLLQKNEEILYDAK